MPGPRVDVSRPIRSIDLLGDGLDARGEVHVPLVEVATRARAAGRRRGAWNRRLVIVSPWQ